MVLSIRVPRNRLLFIGHQFAAPIAPTTTWCSILKRYIPLVFHPRAQFLFFVRSFGYCSRETLGQNWIVHHFRGQYGTSTPVVSMLRCLLVEAWNTICRSLEYHLPTGGVRLLPLCRKTYTRSTTLTPRAYSSVSFQNVKVLSLLQRIWRTQTTDQPPLRIIHP